MALEGLRARLAIPTHRDVAPPTIGSVFATAIACCKVGVKLGFSCSGYGSAGGVQLVRNKLTQDFLESGDEVLVMADSDISWEAESFLRLLELTQTHAVVGATYQVKDGSGQFWLNPLEDGLGEPDQWGCYAVHSFGLGFTAVRREVLEKLSATAPKVLLWRKLVVPEVFKFTNVQSPLAREMGVDLAMQTEDIGFFIDVQALGYDVWLDPSITLGHSGPAITKGRYADVMERDDALVIDRLRIEPVKEACAE